MSNKLQEEVEEVLEEAAEVIHDVGDVIHDVIEGLSEEEVIAESDHPGLEHVILMLRNVTVVVAVILFVLSLIIPEYSHPLKGIGYFLGAMAYFYEIILLTDCFTERIPHREMFMAYCFGPMYILLGLSYVLGH